MILSDLSQKVTLEKCKVALSLLGDVLSVECEDSLT